MATAQCTSKIFLWLTKFEMVAKSVQDPSNRLSCVGTYPARGHK